MNETIQTQINHRTIREFTDEKISSQTLNQLLEVANSTASSNHLQSFSIIRVVDENLKKEISDIANQKYLARVPELLIFIVDQYRNHQIGLEQGQQLEATSDMNSFTQGFTDACLAAQNVVVAAESLGLGTVFFGSILNDVPKLVELLQLPQLTFPVVGVGIGFANQSPQLKPRLPITLKVFTDTYEKKNDYLDLIKEYDSVLNQYYDLRDTNNRVDTFRDQIVNKLSLSNPKRAYIAHHIKNQGFKIDG